MNQGLVSLWMKGRGQLTSGKKLPGAGETRAIAAALGLTGRAADELERLGRRVDDLRARLEAADRSWRKRAAALLGPPGASGPGSPAETTSQENPADTPGTADAGRSGGTPDAGGRAGAGGRADAGSAPGTTGTADTADTADTAGAGRAAGPGPAETAFGDGPPPEGPGEVTAPTPVIVPWHVRLARSRLVVAGVGVPLIVLVAVLLGRSMSGPGPGPVPPTTPPVPPSTTPSVKPPACREGAICLWPERAFRGEMRVWTPGKDRDGKLPADLRDHVGSFVASARACFRDTESGEERETEPTDWSAKYTDPGRFGARMDAIRAC
ncbi:hypothetical protein D5H75_18880 [Bailinhaonella thermotolerans]|uniref:Uncharacterized protein n=1 Tax=Bailinhaonella thermotolerans TaxID=1070861 RepID=A0A3A4B2Z0_9ACTN|nr:hypothetical protein D5H75_18880 [Bailinhaonella thermotolerans]